QCIRVGRTGDWSCHFQPLHRSCEAMIDGSATVLREALGLWRARRFAGFAFDAFAAAEIARLQGLRLEALEVRIGADLAAGPRASPLRVIDRRTVGRAAAASVRCRFGLIWAGPAQFLNSDGCGAPCCWARRRRASAPWAARSSSLRRVMVVGREPYIFARYK